MGVSVDDGRELIQVRHATVRFAGDSGDGMQLIGSQFADIASMTGSAICSFPDFPSDIRAPAGTLGGVSGYQLNFGDQRVMTPGDSPFVLVAMNPAALRVCLPELQEGGIIIANQDAFSGTNLQKAGYDTNPLEDGSLETYRVIPVPMTTLNEEVTRSTGLPKSQRERCNELFQYVGFAGVQRQAREVVTRTQRQTVAEEQHAHARHSALDAAGDHVHVGTGALHVVLGLQPSQHRDLVA